MNYYSHHINDFNNATRHLDRLERSIYRDLIELYYEIEGELSGDLTVVCRRILARSNEEATTVERVLNEFFIKTPSGWYHSRCEEEIERYKNSKSQKAEAGRASAAKKQAKKQRAINGRSTGVEIPLNEAATGKEQTNNGTSTNQEPITNNQEPNKKKKKAAAPLVDFILPEWMPSDLWDRWVKHRSEIKKPLTESMAAACIAKLDDLRRRGYSVAEILNNSISGGWAGLFAPSGGGATKQETPRGRREL